MVWCNTITFIVPAECILMDTVELLMAEHSGIRIIAYNNILQNYGIVHGWQVGREKYYKIIPESIESLTSWLDNIATSVTAGDLPIHKNFSIYRSI